MISFDDIPDQSPAPKLPSFDEMGTQPSWGWGSSLASAVTDIPSEIAKQASQGWQGFKAGFDVNNPRPLSSLGSLVSAAASPITGTVRSLIGHPLAQAEHSVAQAIPHKDLTPEQLAQMPSVISEPLSALQRANPQEMYERAANQAELAASVVGPKGGMRPPTVPIPPRPGPTNPLGVTLSAGQETGDLALIQKEQAALRNQLGAPAQARAQAFKNQQTLEVESAQDRIARSLDPSGFSNIANTPADAGQIVSGAMQSAAVNAKAGVNAAYGTAQSLPGEIHADVFRNMGSAIKNDLSARINPVIVDDALTPYASRALQDVDNRITQLNIQNRASPFGQANPQSIVGVNLQGVDQMRKRLSAFRQQAFASGNAADGRAAQAVIDAFDDRIDGAVNGGQFTGSPTAVQAWNDARAAYADYRRTFTGGPNDPVGRVVEKILGRNQSGPTAVGPATPEKVADSLYGATGINPTDVNRAVAMRIQGILGPQSPEWAAVKQGLFSRIVEKPPGVTEWGPGQIANRIYQFLNGNGRSMAQTVFDPYERSMLQEFANLQRKIQVPQAGANWSGTTTGMQQSMGRMSRMLGVLIGGGLGRAVGLPFLGELAGYGGSKVAAAVNEIRSAKDVAKQLPIVAEQMQQWQKAAAKAARANAPPSQKALAVAGTNLSNVLKPFNIDFATLAGGGDQNQQQRNRGGRPQTSQNDGKGKNPQSFAHGGKVKPFHPQSIGARKAKDGRWYIRDKARPGKYMEVVSHV